MKQHVVQLAVVCSLLASVATGAEQTPAADVPPAGQAGMRVYKDPITGEFKAPAPTEPDARAPTASAQRIDSPPEQAFIVTPSAIPGGGLQLQTNGRFRSYVTAHKDANGRISVECSSDAHAAHALDSR